MTPITGSALPLPMPLASLHTITSTTSSLPASLPSSTLPLPFPTQTTHHTTTTLPTPHPTASTSLTAASPPTHRGTSASLESPPRPSAALVSLVDTYAYKLHLPPAQARLALSLVSSMVGASAGCGSVLHAGGVENQRAWAACCVWLSVVLLELPSSAYATTAFAPQQLVSPTLTELLILFAMPLSTFLRHAAHVLSHITPLLTPGESAVVGERCGVWLQRWLYACAVWRKYEKVYAASIYPLMAAVEQRQSGGGAGVAGGVGLGAGVWRSADLYGCGWLLFQCVKGELRLTEAHPTYVMLLCVLRLMLCCVMREKDKAADGVTTAAASEAAMESALREVCQHDGAVDEQLLSAVRAMHSTDLQPLLSRLQDAGSLRFPAPSQHYALFGPHALQANITSLGALLDGRPQADDVTAVCFVLDERVFLMDRMAEADSGGGVAVQQQAVDGGGGGGGGEIDGKMNGGGKGSVGGAPSHRRILFGGVESNGPAATSPTLTASASSAPALSSSSSLPSSSPLSTSSLTFGTPHKLTTPHHAFSPSLRPPLLPHLPHHHPTTTTTTTHTSHPPTNQPHTPISRMLESVSFLHTTFAPLAAGPSAGLQAYFAARQAGGLEALVRLVSGVVGRVRISDVGGGGGGGSGSSEAKRELGTKIYWSVIDALVKSSSSSSPSAAAPSWLLSRSFHCALLCVCFELVFSAYKHTMLSFPHSLHLFDIGYFDLLKVIDTALRYLPPLPTALKAHLGHMEVSMCERRCWSHGEKAVEMMSDERVRAKVEETMRHAINNQSTNALNNAHKRASSDEMKDDVTLSSAPDSATAPSTSSLPLPASAAFRADFSALLSLYRKLLSLCADRLSYMATDLALSLSPLQQQATWTLLLHCLLRHASLLFGRHVDTLLLCALYTVKVKICKSEYDFKRIITVYIDRWDREVSEVIREVEGKAGEADGGAKAAGSGENAGSRSGGAGAGGRKKLQIIQFYNEIFIPTLQDFIIGTLKPAVLTPSAPTTSAASSTTTSSTSSSSTTRPPPLSPLPIRNRHTLSDGSSPGDTYPTIFISTMRSSVPASPQRRVLSAVVGESPTKRLQEMNEMLAMSGSSRRGGAGVRVRGGAGGSMAGSKQLFRGGGNGVEDGGGKGEVVSVMSEAGGGDGSAESVVVGAADGVAALLLASGSTAGSNGHTHR